MQLRETKEIRWFRLSNPDIIIKRGRGWPPSVSGDPVRRPAPRLFFMTGERLDSMDWYPHHISDYDADTLHLTIAEDGAYCRLLRWYYANERPLPNDDQALASICRIGLSEWLAIAPKIKSFFVTRDTRECHVSVMHHKRCDSQILKQNKHRRDWQSRQKKLRKHGILDDVTRDTRVSHASKGEERKGNNIDLSLRSKSIDHRSNDIPKLDGFDAFWAACPRKIGKGGAQRSYAKALTQASAADLLAAMQCHAERVRGKDPKYIPHPATWLNQQRWLDEPDPLSRRDATLKALDQIGGTDGE